MKKIKLSRLIMLFAIISGLVFQSCNQDENILEENKIPIKTSEFKLKLNSFDSLGKEFDLPNDDIAIFIKDNFNEILKLDEKLELNIYSGENNKKFKINRIKETIDREEELLFISAYPTETVCETCTNEECVTSALRDAVGEGDIDVNIRVRVKRFLGVQTGLEVCYDRIP